MTDIILSSSSAVQRSVFGSQLPRFSYSILMTYNKSNIRYQEEGLGTYSRNLQSIKCFLKFHKYVLRYIGDGLTELLYSLIFTTLCQLLVYIASVIVE